MRYSVIKSWGLAIALIVISVALSFAMPNFLTVSNLINVVRQISINGILAVGVTYVLLTGGVDLSLGSLVALTGVVAACFAHPKQYPVVVPVLWACWRDRVRRRQRSGRHQGPRRAVHRYARHDDRGAGLALVISGGRPVSDLSSSFTRLGGDVAGMPVPAIILAVIASHRFSF